MEEEVENEKGKKKETQKDMTRNNDEDDKEVEKEEKEKGMIEGEVERGGRRRKRRTRRRSYSILSTAPRVGGKTFALFIEAEEETVFLSHLLFHLQSLLPLKTDYRQLQVHYELKREGGELYEEEAGGSGWLSYAKGLFAESIEWDFTVSIRETLLPLNVSS